MIQTPGTVTIEQGPNGPAVTVEGFVFTESTPTLKDGTREAIAWAQSVLSAQQVEP